MAEIKVIKLPNINHVSWVTWNSTDET